MVSKTEHSYLEDMHDLILKRGPISKQELIIESNISIAWAEKLIKYLPYRYNDILYDKKKRVYTPLSTLSELEKEMRK